MPRSAYLNNHKPNQRCAMENLTELLDSIDAAYRVAAKTDREVASLLLLASLNVSQKLEARSAHEADGKRKAN